MSLWNDDKPTYASDWLEAICGALLVLCIWIVLLALLGVAEA